MTPSKVQKLREIQDALNERGCSDHNCLIRGKAKGQGTNSGCHCVRDQLDIGYPKGFKVNQILTLLQQKIRFLEEEVKELEDNQDRGIGYGVIGV